MSHTMPTETTSPSEVANRRRWQLPAILKEDFLARHADGIFLSLFGLFIITALLLFDTKLFLMGDDADYIVDAVNFVEHQVYPSGRSSLYTMVMSIFIAFGGISIIQLKLFSFCCAIAAFCLAYFTFKNRIPYRLLFISLLFAAINAEIQYYSSSNLSEAFFMMIQMLFFHAAFLLYDRLQETGSSRRMWPYWCYAGVAVLLLTLSKNVAAAALLCLPVFFLLLKKWRAAFISLAVLLAAKLLSEWLIHALYGSHTVMSQVDQVLAKDLYHPEYGRETALGFVVRFLTNLPVYLSKNLLIILGLREEGVTGTGGFFWVLPVALLLFAMWKAYKSNPYLFFAGVYMCIMMGASFLALQPGVAQMRIIIIYVPLLLCVVLYGVYRMGPRISRIAIPVFCTVLLTASLYRLVRKVKGNVPVLVENLKGDPYYGYTPDWINYLQMGQYVTAEIAPDTVVAARKPNSLSVCSGGRSFAGIYRVSEQATADELLAELKAADVHYLILASFRQNPRRASGKIVNTLHRYVKIISARYPDKVKVVKSIGVSEPCHLLKIDY